MLNFKITNSKGTSRMLLLQGLSFMVLFAASALNLGEVKALSYKPDATEPETDESGSPVVDNNSDVIKVSSAQNLKHALHYLQQNEAIINSISVKPSKAINQFDQITTPIVLLTIAADGSLTERSIEGVANLQDRTVEYHIGQKLDKNTAIALDLQSGISAEIKIV
jgi:hypothetical protein